MPRALSPGTYGEILVIELGDGRVKARARYRDYDGRTRIVSRTNTTAARATRDLKGALVERRGAGGIDVSNSTRVEALADLWLEQPHDWSIGTRRTYGYIVATNVKPALGSLRVGEVTPAVVARALNAIQREHPSAAKSTKACLSGMFALAIAHGAVQSNPVRDAPIRISVKGKRARSLSRAEADGLCDWLRTDTRALEQDLPDLVDWMLATGARLGEATAARHDVNSDGLPLLDLAAGTWEIDSTVIRKPGGGLLIQQRPKTKAGWRIVAIPSHAVALLERRRAEIRPTPSQIVFGSPQARQLRDPSNTAADLRDTLARYRHVSGVDLTWVTSHTFRKTVATWLEEAGFTPREVADHLGHAHPSMTMDVYFGRKIAAPKAATALER